jgi:hypothetical protein
LKTFWGNVKRVNSPYGSWLEGCPRKTYTRTHKPKSGFNKIPIMKRENAAIIKLTRLGYSINQLNTVLGRSTSYIHKVIKNAISFGILTFLDKRKSTGPDRALKSKIRANQLEKLISAWMPFILGESDRPP